MILETLVERVPEVTWARRPVCGVEIEAIAIDSRDVEPGSLFVALEGTHADGHDFVGDALERGAAAILVHRNRADAMLAVSEGPVLVADRTRHALGPLSAVFFDHPSQSLEIVGITGTNGKTTISHMLERIIEAAGERAGVVGTIQHRWGDCIEDGPNTTPESLELQRIWQCMVEDDVDRVALEVSSHGLATHRMRGTIVDRAVFTNLTRDHLDFHGDMASYRRAKERLFTEVLPRSREAGVEAEAVLNLDDPVGRELVGLVEERAIPVTSYGLEHAPSDVSGTIVEASLEGTTLAVETSGGESFTFEMSLLGSYNAENALAASATALSMGIDSEVVQQGLTDIDAISGRLERIGSPSTGPHVYVDYAHTPDALERVLQTLRPLTPGRLVAVFGCGGDRDRDKRPEMGRIADAVADRIWITSDNPRTEDPVAIIEDIVGGLPALDSATSDEHRERRVEPERHRAIERAIDEAVRDDVVLIAGKGHEQYQEIDGERHDFDDAERARQALGRYAPRRDKP